MQYLITIITLVQVILLGVLLAFCFKKATFYANQKEENKTDDKGYIYVGFICFYLIGQFIIEKVADHFIQQLVSHACNI